MSFDGITTRVIVNELNQILVNSRIEKIYVPNKNEIIISFILPYLH
jgi:predicted ribosome quality control (RQC) complex YloA/Tae2 family protein